MPHVASSAIDWVDHDAATETLEIRYKGGDRYSYFRVPVTAYRALLKATSIGAFVNEEIKPRYQYEIESRRRRFRPG
jgi:hypothetical protein